MRFKSAMLALIALICLTAIGTALDTYDTTSIAEDVKDTFQNEQLFNVSPITGMSSNATSNLVATPIMGVRGSISVGGSWLLNLKDTTSSVMRLNLNQYQDAVFGSGDVSKGGVVTNVSVGGTIAGNRLNLYVTPQGDNGLYRMSITIGAGSMNGNYEFKAPGISQFGLVYGSLTMPSQVNQLQNGVMTSYNEPVMHSTMPLGPKNQITVNGPKS